MERCPASKVVPNTHRMELDVGRFMGASELDAAGALVPATQGCRVALCPVRRRPDAGCCPHLQQAFRPQRKPGRRESAEGGCKSESAQSIISDDLHPVKAARD